MSARRSCPPPAAVAFAAVPFRPLATSTRSTGTADSEIVRARCRCVGVGRARPADDLAAGVGLLHIPDDRSLANRVLRDEPEAVVDVGRNRAAVEDDRHDAPVALLDVGLPLGFALDEEEVDAVRDLHSNRDRRHTALVRDRERVALQVGRPRRRRLHDGVGPCRSRNPRSQHERTDEDVGSAGDVDA